MDRCRFIYCVSNVQSWLLDKANSENLGHVTWVFKNDRPELVLEVFLRFFGLIFWRIVLFGCEQVVKHFVDLILTLFIIYVFNKIYLINPKLKEIDT